MNKKIPGSASDSRSAQAMAEFVIGLLALLVALVGILSVTMLATADTESFEEAREEAIGKALQSGFEDSFSPVRDNKAGADGIALSQDDVVVPGSLSSVRSRIAGHAAESGFTEAIRSDYGSLRHGALFDFADGVKVADAFALRKGESSRTVFLPPAASALFGATPERKIRNEVWMTEAGDVP